ncbi:hypothetical protein ACWXVL_01315 [Mycoplasma sp. 128]|uniref:hypothetical protein n=1 Tax=Mycoplasma sp. 3341 TaxID=3447506 RepID=UPI003F660567
MAVRTRFYIIEKRDEENNLTWHLKRAKQDNYFTFDNFQDSLNKFIEIAKGLEGDSRVWFHQNGAFRGSMGMESALKSIEELQANNVSSQEATDYLVSKNLIESSSKKEDEEEKEEQQQPVEEAKPVSYEEQSQTTTVVTYEKVPKGYYVLVSLLLILVLVCIILVAVAFAKK